MTLIAAIIAWFAVQTQINAQEKNIRNTEAIRRAELDQREVAAKSVAIIVVTQPVHAAAAFLYSVRKASKATGKDIPQWDLAMKQAHGQLEHTLDHFSLREISPEMAIDDRLPFLILIVQLSSIVNIFNRPIGIRGRDETLKLMANQLAGLRHYLMTFDIDLANVFERDSII